MLIYSTSGLYTCQLFLRYKREIFILGVLEFLQTKRSFLMISEEVRSLPKTSEVCRRRSYRENAYPQNQRSRERYCYLFIYTALSFLTWVWLLEILSSKMATTHIFQSDVRNWPAGVSRREIEVFNLQAWELAGIGLTLIANPAANGSSGLNNKQQLGCILWKFCATGK